MAKVGRRRGRPPKVAKTEEVSTDVSAGSPDIGQPEFSAIPAESDIKAVPEPEKSAQTLAETPPACIYCGCQEKIKATRHEAAGLVKVDVCRHCGRRWVPTPSVEKTDGRS